MIVDLLLRFPECARGNSSKNGGHSIVVELMNIVRVQLVSIPYHITLINKSATKP